VKDDKLETNANAQHATHAHRRSRHRQEVPGAPTPRSSNLLQDTLGKDGQMAMGVESEVVRTHGQEGLEGHVFVSEVLRGVLYLEAHNNRSKKIIMNA
jgi:hypothetical protein